MAIDIKKQTDGTYAVRVYSKTKDAFGKRKTKYKSGIKTIAVAKKWATETEDMLSYENEINDNITFKQLGNYYLEARQIKMSPATVSRLKQITEQTNDFLGNVKISNINTRIVQQFINQLSKQDNKYKPGQHLKKGTLEKYYRYIQSAINWGVANDYLEYNRIKKIEFPDDEVPFEATVLSAEKIGEILSFLKVNCYNIYIPVLLSVTTSLRRGEALGLKWESVDLDNGIIDINNNRIMFGYTILDKAKMKTSKSKRTLVLSEFTKNELREHKDFCKYINSPYVCASPFDEELSIKPDYLTRTFHKIMQTQFNIKMRIHDLRHCFNQFAYEENIDETTRIKIMGHSNFEINRNVYTQSSLKKNKEAMNCIASEIEKSFNQKL